MSDARIYVGNLPLDIKEKELEELFYKVLACYCQFFSLFVCVSCCLGRSYTCKPVAQPRHTPHGPWYFHHSSHT
jgi:hypothetical protein